MRLTPEDVPVGRTKVFVDGKEVNYVTEIEPVMGWVEYMARDENGDPIAHGEDFVHRQVKAKESLRLEFTYDA